VEIYYDDGDKEVTTLSMVRVRRGVSGHNWAEGHRVLAQSEYDGYLYPGVIERAEEDSLYILFDDGDRGQLSPERVVPLALLRAGQRAECRWQGGDFYPCRIDRREGDRVFIQYDDGDREATTVGMVRVPPQALPAWQPGR
jgi:hypothetical protein